MDIPENTVKLCICNTKIDRLPTLPFLESLYISGSHINRITCKFPSMVELYIQDSNVRNLSGGKRDIYVPSLETLDIVNSDVRWIPKYAPNLKTLHISRIQWGIEKLPSYPSLVTLDLTDIGAEVKLPDVFPQIKYLYIRSSGDGYKPTLTHVPAYMSLRHVDLSNSIMKRENIISDIEHLYRIPNIEIVDAYNVQDRKGRIYTWSMRRI